MIRHQVDGEKDAVRWGLWGRILTMKRERPGKRSLRMTPAVLGLETRRLMAGDVAGLSLLEYTDPRTGQVFLPEASTLVASSPAGVPTSAAASGALFPLSSVPALNSLPGARASIYLDFVGDYESSWGSYSQISTPAFDTDGDPTTFSTAELSAIQSIWSYVAEDYSPFNVNVTTVAPPSFENGVSVKMVIGGTGGWTGQVYGGISYIGSFSNDMPNVSFVFSKNLGNGNARYTADATSHEAGHAFGLSHQSGYSGSTLTQEYYTGPGNGTAPIMGNSYSAGLSRWWYGLSDVSSVSVQDDMSIIAGPTNGFGYRPESAGTSAASATLLNTTSDRITASGVILNGQDINVYTLLAGVGEAQFTIQVSAGYNDLVPTLQLFDSTGTVLLASASVPPQGSSATIDYTFNQEAGYRLVVRSDGTYGNVGQYWLGGTVVPPSSSLYVPAPSNLSASVAGTSQINVSWTPRGANEAGFVVTRSTDGVTWTAIAGLPAGATSYADGSVSQGTTYLYRVQAYSVNMISDPSNTAAAAIPAAVDGPPAGVTGLSIVSRASNSIKLAWVDNAGNESGYLVQRSNNGGKTWSTIAALGPDSTSYVDRSVKGGKRYLYRVVGFNSRGNASPSNTIALTTPRFSAAQLAHTVRAAKRSVKHAAARPKLATSTQSASTDAVRPAQLAAASVSLGIIPQGSKAFGLNVDWTPVTA